MRRPPGRGMTSGKPVTPWLPPPIDTDTPRASGVWYIRDTTMVTVVLLETHGAVDATVKLHQVASSAFS
eukprot:m.207252 g.207252  ORF g.207252 m.207252 type:complete len:69 (+) comp25388_c0_seq1:2566-2772(+)